MFNKTHLDHIVDIYTRHGQNELRHRALRFQHSFGLSRNPRLLFDCAEVCLSTRKASAWQ
jgi:hypothetical protein